MADIQADLDVILSQDYGEDVRSAVYTGLSQINAESESVKDFVVNSSTTEPYVQLGLNTLLFPTYNTASRQGKFIASNGNVGVTSACDISDDFTLTSGTIVVIEESTLGNYSVLARHTGDDEGGNPIFESVQAAVNSGSAVVRRSYTIRITTSGQYAVNRRGDSDTTKVFTLLANTLLKDSDGNIYDSVAQSVNNQFSQLTLQMENITSYAVRANYVNLEFPESRQNKFIAISGIVANSNTYKYSNEFHIDSGKLLVIQTHSADAANNISLLSKLNPTGSDTEYTSIITSGGNGWQMVKIKITDGGDFAVVCTKANSAFAVIYDDDPVEDPKDENIYIFGKVACIGDSQTRGAQNYLNSNRDLGYPQILARKTGIDFRNFGISGCVAKTWLSTSTGYGDYNFSAYDAAFIMLGRNWKATETQTIDEAIAEDAAYYRDIIDKLRTETVDRPVDNTIPIFCFSLPPQTSNTTEKLEIDAKINAAIQAIAEAKNCYYIDIYHAWTLEDNNWRNTGGSSHLLPLGLTRLAKIVLDEVNNCIQANKADFMRVWVPNNLPVKIGDISFLDSFPDNNT